MELEGGCKEMLARVGAPRQHSYTKQASL